MKSFFAAALAVVAKVKHEWNHENSKRPNTFYPA